MNNITGWLLFLGLSFLSGAPKECMTCVDSYDTLPSKVIERVVIAPLDSLKRAKTIELDSISLVHDSIKEKLDSLRRKPFIGRKDKFRLFNGKIHISYWWYIYDKYNQKNFIRRQIKEE